MLGEGGVGGWNKEVFWLSWVWIQPNSDCRCGVKFRVTKKGVHLHLDICARLDKKQQDVLTSLWNHHFLFFSLNTDFSTVNIQLVMYIYIYIGKLDWQILCSLSLTDYRLLLAELDFRKSGVLFIKYSLSKPLLRVRVWPLVKNNSYFYFQGPNIMPDGIYTYTSC